jgi:hypothetical protein
MQSFQVKVTKQSGEAASYLVTPKTIVAFERAHKIGLAKALSENQKLSDIYWLGWESERSSAATTGDVVPAFDAWLDSVTSVELVEADVPFGENPSVT